MLQFQNHDCRIRVRRYVGERCLSESVIEEHIDLTPKVMVLRAISYHGRSDLLRIEGNQNSKRYVHEERQLEVVPFLQGMPGANFQQNNAHPHIAKTVREFCSIQHMQLFRWSAYLPGISPIDPVCGLGDRCLDLHPRTVAPKDEILLRLQSI
ncbi:transposable element Tc1 transposase [Trichonephila clavipes]|nr:transposable element Tc1 transposase [Trichonephila clavipes]